MKQRVSFGDAVSLLALTVKQNGNQWRGACPACKKGGDRALVITEQKGFFCFGSHKGGDVIALVAHVKEINVKEAANFLAKNVGTGADSSRTVPEVVESGKVLEPLGYLEHDHDAVVAIGVDPALAKRMGIGYAPKGLMRGTVAWPIRDETGKLLGYIGTESDVRLPPDFQSNIVPLRKKS